MLSLGLKIGIGSTRVQSGFAITDVSGLQLWLKFNEGQVTTDDGLKWSDSSGNSNHATQTTDSHEGAFASGFYRTDANANDHLEFTSQIDLTGAYHVFMVIDLSEQTNETFLSSTNSSTSFMRLWQGSDTTFRIRQNTSSNQADISMSEAFGTDKAIFEVTRDGSNDISALKNGSQVGTASSQTGTFEANQISAHSAGLSSAQIGEVLIFNTILDSATATKVRNDVADRNSLSI